MIYSRTIAVATIAICYSAIMTPVTTAALLRSNDSVDYLHRILQADPKQQQQQQQQRTCNIEDGFDYLGEDIASFPGPVESCCDKCATVQGCKAFSWSNYNGGTCWLKSKRGKVVPNPDVKSAIATFHPRPVCDIRDNVDYKDHDIGNAPSATAEGCCDICHNTEGCRVFSWSNYNGGTCWLKSKPGKAVVAPGVRSAKAYPAWDERVCAIQNNVNFVGNDLVSVPGKNAQACCGICKDYDGCGAFTWTESDGGMCKLKSRMNEQEPRAGYKSAVVQ